MKKLTVVAFAFLAAGAAMAQDTSRAQVLAELQRARASGELALQHSENPEAFGRAQLAVGGQPANRAAVLTDLRQARESGTLAAQSRDSHDHLKTATPTGSAKTRAEVIAELQRARANGGLDAVNNYSGYSHLVAIAKPAKVAPQVMAERVQADGR